MKTSLYHSISLVLLLLTLAALSIGAAAETAAGDAADPIRGAQSWADNCSRCHNMRDPSEFRDDLWRPIMTHMRMRAGLTGQQTRDILAFLQASNYRGASARPVKVATTTASPPVDAALGATVYNQTCVVCHGADGKGAIPGVPDFTAADGALAKSDDVLLQHIIEGFKSPEAIMMMPARGGNPALTDAELAATLAHIRTNFSR